MIESLGESCIIFESTIQALVVSIRSCNYPISGSFCRVTLKFWKALKPCFGIWCEALELDRLTKFKACAQSPPRIFFIIPKTFFSSSQFAGERPYVRLVEATTLSTHSAVQSTPDSSPFTRHRIRWRSCDWQPSASSRLHLCARDGSFIGHAESATKKGIQVYKYHNGIYRRIFFFFFPKLLV